MAALVGGLPLTVWSRTFEHYYDTVEYNYKRTARLNRALTPLLISKSLLPPAIRALYTAPCVAYDRITAFHWAVSRSNHREYVRRLHLTTSGKQQCPISPGQARKWGRGGLHRALPRLFSKLSVQDLDLSVFIHDGTDARILLAALSRIRVHHKARIELRMMDNWSDGAIIGDGVQTAILDSGWEKVTPAISEEGSTLAKEAAEEEERELLAQIAIKERVGLTTLLRSYIAALDGRVEDSSRPWPLPPRSPAEIEQFRLANIDKSPNAWDKAAIESDRLRKGLFPLLGRANQASSLVTGKHEGEAVSPHDREFQSKRKPGEVDPAVRRSEIAKLLEFDPPTVDEDPLPLSMEQYAVAVTRLVREYGEHGQHWDDAVFPPEYKAYPRHGDEKQMDKVGRNRRERKRARMAMWDARSKRKRDVINYPRDAISKSLRQYWASQLRIAQNTAQRVYDKKMRESKREMERREGVPEGHEAEMEDDKVVDAPAQDAENAADNLDKEIDWDASSDASSDESDMEKMRDKMLLDEVDNKSEPGDEELDMKAIEDPQRRFIAMERDVVINMDETIQCRVSVRRELVPLWTARGARIVPTWDDEPEPSADPSSSDSNNHQMDDKVLTLAARERLLKTLQHEFVVPGGPLCPGLAKMRITSEDTKIEPVAWLSGTIPILPASNGALPFLPWDTGLDLAVVLGPHLGAALSNWTAAINLEAGDPVSARILRGDLWPTLGAKHIRVCVPRTQHPLDVFRSRERVYLSAPAGVVHPHTDAFELQVHTYDDDVRWLDEAIPPGVYRIPPSDFFAIEECTRQPEEEEEDDRPLSPSSSSYPSPTFSFASDASFVDVDSDELAESGGEGEGFDRVLAAVQANKLSSQ